MFASHAHGVKVSEVAKCTTILPLLFETSHAFWNSIGKLLLDSVPICVVSETTSSFRAF